MAYDPSTGGFQVVETLSNSLYTGKTNVDLVGATGVTSKDILPPRRLPRKRRFVGTFNRIFGVFRIRVNGRRNLICPGFECSPTEGICIESPIIDTPKAACRLTCGDNLDEDLAGQMKKVAFFFGPDSLPGTRGLPYPWDLVAACFTKDGLNSDPWQFNEFTLLNPDGSRVFEDLVPFPFFTDIYKNAYTGVHPRIPFGYQFTDDLSDLWYYLSSDLSSLQAKTPLLYPNRIIPPFSTLPNVDGLNVIDHFTRFLDVDGIVDNDFQGPAPRTEWQARALLNTFLDPSGTELIPFSNWGYASIVVPKGTAVTVPPAIENLFDYPASQVFDSEFDCASGANFWDDPEPPDDGIDFGWQYYYFSNSIPAPVPFDLGDIGLLEGFKHFVVTTSGVSSIGQIISRGGNDDIDPGGGDPVESTRCSIWSNVNESDPDNIVISSDSVTKKDRPEAFLSDPNSNWLSSLLSDYRDSDLVFQDLDPLDDGICYQELTQIGVSLQDLPVPSTESESGDQEFQNVYTISELNIDPNATTPKTVREHIIDGSFISNIQFLYDDVRIAAPDSLSCPPNESFDAVASFRAVPGVQDVLTNAGISDPDEVFDPVNAPGNTAFEIVSLGVIISQASLTEQTP